ncbi:MAG: hypothetical protein KGM16_11700 [Bacteroidota bacterium]|nr:hypothetical protein [Bacteroidota bacterium]
MIQKFFTLSVLLLASLVLFAQKENDSTVKVNENYITLSEIVVNKKLDVASFIDRVKNDTTFYKAFRNLRMIGYTAINDIRMLDKNETIRASLHSTTQQMRKGNCRTMKVLDQKTTGNIFDRQGNFNYYTAQMYAGLFFTKDSVCGENNIVKGYEFSTSGLSGIEKHKQQLKMLFFDPGKKISGLPFISNKTEIFNPSMAENYDMYIDYRNFNSVPCYVFTINVKDNRKSNVVIDEMTTWFNAKTFEIVARNYVLSYDAGVYDFNVKMEVQMTKVGDLLVPNLITYNGNWKVIFNKRERGVFTATLSDFVR